jgi:hypothetical protein
VQGNQSGATVHVPLFRDTQPVHSGDDLARQGVFANREVEEFIADLRAMRHADLS